MIPNYPRGKRIINYGAKLSEIEKDFIHRNAKTSTAKEIAIALRKSYTLIYEYCRKTGIQYKETKPTGRSKKDTDSNISRIVKSVSGGKNIEKQEFTRPEAKYDNRSWEEIIQYYEKLKV